LVDICSWDRLSSYRNKPIRLTRDICKKIEADE
jgi:hypothetical protein